MINLNWNKIINSPQHFIMPYKFRIKFIDVNMKEYFNRYNYDYLYVAVAIDLKHSYAPSSKFSCKYKQIIFGG